jgi:LysR family hydrogen peroxide-inducible transcriptional activator
MRLLPSLKQLEYLTALAETEHFGKAAELCNVTPSTLSAGIRELEDLLGVPIAERTKRVVLMTDLGREIATRAGALIRDAEDLMGLAAAHHEPMTGDMVLGVIPTIGPFLLPLVLPRLGAAYPDLRIFLREERTADLLSRLRAGSIDAALIALPYETEGLMARPLFDDGFLFACPPDHPQAARRRITDADLAAQPLLLLEEGHCLRGHALDACRLAGSAARVQFEATSIHTLVQMVAAGIGVTLLPEMAVAANITAGTNIRLLPLAEAAVRHVGLVWRRASPRAREFELLARMIAERHAGGNEP